MLEIHNRVLKTKRQPTSCAPCAWGLVSKLKELTKNSSTIIVGNHDHSPELWAKSMEHPHIWKQTVDNCDAIFATTPTAHNLMNNILDTKVNLIPHPCETHVMKRIGTVKKFDHIAVVHHRYDNNVLMPFLHLEKFKKTLTLIGYHESEDPRNRITKCLYDNILSYMPFPDFIKVMKEAYYLYDSYEGYSYGRVGCDAACLQTPLVGSKNVYSHQILYPYTSVNQYDTKEIQSKFDKLINDGEFYDKVIKTAYERVEHFNWVNSKKRFKEMLDNVKK